MSSFKQEFNDDAVQKHNEYRSKHGAPPIVLDAELAEAAQKYADNLATLGKLQHSAQEERNSAGENLAFMGGTAMTGSGATDMWYSEVKDYDFNNPGFGGNTGHFTQVVWVASSKVGFGIASKDDSHYVVGRYFPAGNLMGAFPENVLQEGSEVKVESSAEPAVAVNEVSKSEEKNNAQVEETATNSNNDVANANSSAEKKESKDAEADKTKRGCSCTII